MAGILETICGVVGALPQIKEYVVTPLKNQFSYLFRYDKLIQSLKVEQERLDATRVHLQRAIVAARNNLELIGPDVDDWCRRVDELKMKTDRILGATPELQKGCLHGSCPNVKLRYSNSREAKKLTEVAVGLQNESSKFNLNIAYPAPPLGFEAIPPVSDSGFDSRRSIEEEIMAGLKADTVYITGVCGMGGVGKTTMVNKIAKLASQEKLFDFVVVAVVSQQPKVQDIQLQIAEALDLKLEKQTVPIRASLVRARLMDVKRVLVVLDDVWERLNLEEIGIPTHSIHKGCKIILTTRDLHVCVEMNSSKIFQLEVLHDKEAWTLFKEKAGSVVDQPDLRELAIDVAKECKGLPLGIITVAGSMRGVVDICEWRNVLEQLESCSVGFTEMEDKVFPILEWSFNRLNGCEKHCFLYCCLYPEDWYIEREELINLFILAELLIPRRKNRESEHDHGRTILNKLVRACLLEETRDFRKRECIKMHDLIRDMALRITGRNSRREMKGDVPRFLVSGIEANVIVEESEWTEDLNAVSFARPFFYDDDRSLEIPSDMSPKCKNLSTLLFQGANIERIPDSFFRDMNGLKVLDLRGCSDLKELPNSVSNLVNLTALLLRGCSELESVPPLGKLKQLRELDLSETRIGDIPQGLELLVKLERLDMGGTRLKKKTIPKGTFSRLIRLEHLILPKSVPICDSQVLKQLQVFSGCLTSIDVDNEFMTSPCWPKHYDICVVEEETPFGDFLDSIFYYDRNKLEFERCNFKKGLDVNLLAKDIKELRLNKCFGFSDGNLRNLIRRSKDLVHLEIRHSEEVEFVVNFSSPPPHPLYDDNELVVLPNLKKLRLYNLRNFVGLINWGRQQQQLIPPGTFSSLTDLTIYGCHRLKKLFTVQLLSQQHILQNLERLYVGHCGQLEEMMAANDNDEGMGEEIVIHPSSSSSTLRLPKLHYLTLRNLPQLENKNCKAIISDSIKEIGVRNCPKLKRMPVSVYIPINNINTTNAGNGQTSSSSAPPPNTLLEIYGSEEWWESLEWDHYPPNAQAALLPVFRKM